MANEFVCSQVAAGSTAAVGASGLTLAEGKNIAAGTVAGTKIGTAATQKLGFFNHAPVVQPASTPAAATDPATTMALVNDLRTKLLALGLVG